MVWIVKDWSDFEARAGGGRGLGTYQIRDTTDGKEIRVKCGRLGFVGVYKDNSDSQYGRIISWVAHEGFIEIKESIPDEVFHL